MDNDNVGAFIQGLYNGHFNGMTPEVIAYGSSTLDANLVFEISKGRGMFGNDYMIGVTVCDVAKRVRRPDLSHCFSGNLPGVVNEAREYAYNLVEGDNEQK